MRDIWAGLIRSRRDTVYYKRGRCEGKVMAMVILGFVICFSLGACIGFVAVGMFANASNRVQRDA